MYAKYAFGSFTIGMQFEADGVVANDDDEFSAHGITYQVTEDLTIGYHASEKEMGNKTADQETKYSSCIHNGWYDFESSISFC